MVKTLGRSCSSSEAPLALGLGLLVLRARASAFFSILASMVARADLHAHAVHRGAGGGRKDVDRLDGLGAGVLEELLDLHLGDDAGDVDLGGRLLQRQALGLGGRRRRRRSRARRLVLALVLAARRGARGASGS
jgi:hypothetical protein